MKTVTDLLETMDFMRNQTHLAKALNVSRNTVRKYMSDTKGQYHCITYFNGAPQLMALTSAAKKAKKL